MRDFDSNAEIYSCMKLLRDGIRKEDLPKFETEIEKLKYINNLKFDPEALKNYQDFINEQDNMGQPAQDQHMER